MGIMYDDDEDDDDILEIARMVEEIEIEDMEALINVLKLASNVEVYPKTDGTVQLDITFHGLTRNE